MDKLLRELQREAATGDSLAIQRYLSAIIRSPENYREIEARARWGEQQFIPLYLRLLDIKGIIDLNNLWVCPYAYMPYEFDYNRNDPILEVFPYTLDMGYKDVIRYLRDVGNEFVSHAKHYPDIEINAFVVDVRDLELADKVQQSMYGHLNNVEADDYAVYLYSPWTAASFYVLQGAAILKIGPTGVKFTEADDIALPAPSTRKTRRYFGRYGAESYPYYPFPRREYSPQLVGQPLSRGIDEPYVVIIHMPTTRGFTLGGNYRLLNEDASPETMESAIRYNQQVDYGYAGGHPWPAWTEGLPKREFVAYWVAT